MNNKSFIFSLVSLTALCLVSCGSSNDEEINQMNMDYSIKGVVNETPLFSSFRYDESYYSEFDPSFERDATGYKNVFTGKHIDTNDELKRYSELPEYDYYSDYIDEETSPLRFIYYSALFSDDDMIYDPLGNSFKWTNSREVKFSYYFTSTNSQSYCELTKMPRDIDNRLAVFVLAELDNTVFYKMYDDAIFNFNYKFESSSMNNILDSSMIIPSSAEVKRISDYEWSCRLEERNSRNNVIYSDIGGDGPKYGFIANYFDSYENENHNRTLFDYSFSKGRAYYFLDYGDSSINDFDFIITNEEIKMYKLDLNAGKYKIKTNLSEKNFIPIDIKLNATHDKMFISCLKIGSDKLLLPTTYIAICDLKKSSVKFIDYSNKYEETLAKVGNYYLPIKTEYYFYLDTDRGIFADENEIREYKYREVMEPSRFVGAVNKPDGITEYYYIRNSELKIYHLEGTEFVNKSTEFKMIDEETIVYTKNNKIFCQGNNLHEYSYESYRIETNTAYYTFMGKKACIVYFKVSSTYYSIACKVPSYFI